MPPGLATIGQDDYAAGIVRGQARHLMPGSSVWDVVNGLLDDDGAVYRRGGSVYKSSSAFAASIAFLWDGYLPAVGLRTVVGYSSAFGILDPADDAAPMAVGGGGISVSGTPAQIGDFLWIPGGRIYAGSKKASSYSTGTLALTAGSKAVVGTGTSFSANIDAGMLLEISGDTTRFYVVESVTDNTHLTLREAWHGSTGSGATYAAAAVKTGLYPEPQTSGQRGFAAATHYAVSGGRLLAAIGNRLYMSKGVDPTTGLLRPQEYDSEYHEFPDSGEIIGLVGLRDRALVFTTGGTWIVSNLAFNLVDAAGNPQQRVERVSTTTRLWGAPGLTQFEGSVIAPTVDGVFLMDGVSQPVAVGRSIAPLIRDHVRAGHKIGGAAVYRNHYFLPVTSADGSPLELLVCRLDRPVNTGKGNLWPWTRFEGHAGSVRCLATRTATGEARAPKLLAGAPSGRLLDLSSTFEPSASVKQDADATTHNLELETRDFRTGRPGTRNTVTRARLRYSLDGTSDSPTLALSYSNGSEDTDASVPLWDTVDWDEFEWAGDALVEFINAPGQAPEDDGRTPYVWSGWGCRGEFFRARIVSSGPIATLTLHELQLAVRQSAYSW